MICIYEKTSAPANWETLGLAVLLPSECKVSVTAGAEDELQLIHALDPEGRWKLITEERILRVPVPATVIPASVSGVAADYWRVREDRQGRVYRQPASSHTVPGTPYPEWNRTTAYAPGACVSYNKKSYRARESNAGGAPTVATSYWEEIPNPTTTVSYTPIATLDPLERYRLLAQTNSSWQRIRTQNGITGYISMNDVEFVDNDDPEDIDERIIRTQCYRIYTVNVDHEKMTVTANARHISYDFAFNLCGECDLADQTVPSALGEIQDACMVEDDRLLATNITGEDASLITADYSWQNPIYAILDPDKGLVEASKARLIRDNRDLFLVTNDDETIQYELRYGKNLTGVSWKRSVDELVTRVVPIAEDADGNVLMLPEKWIDSAYINAHPLICMEYLKVDCKEGEQGMVDDEEVASLTKDQCYTLMRKAAQERYDTDHADEVKVELTVSFIHLGDTEEYRQYRDMETLHLYDRVLIHDTPLGLRATAQVKSFVWNCLTERYESITLGDVFDTLGSSIVGYDLDRECVRYEKLNTGAVKRLRSGLATDKELKETNASLQSTMYTANTATRNITSIIEQLRSNYQIDIHL